MKQRYSAGVPRCRQTGSRDADSVPRDTDVTCPFRTTPQADELPNLSDAEVVLQAERT